MLQLFRDKFVDEACASHISLVEGDMENFALGERFDWVIFPFRAFQSLSSDASRKACLESVKTHMKAGSRLVLTLFNPNDEILDAWGKQNVLDFEGVDKKYDWQVKRYQDLLAHDKQVQTISARLRFHVFNEGELLESCEDELKLGYLYPEQCQALFDACGLKVEHAYGAYKKRPIVEDEKKEQVYIFSLDS